MVLVRNKNERRIEGLLVPENTEPNLEEFAHNGASPRPYADMPIRPYADTFLSLSTPTRRYADTPIHSPPSQRRYALTPIHSSPLANSDTL